MVNFNWGKQTLSLPRSASFIETQMKDYVLNGDKELVSVWRGHIHPDAFASVLAALGFYYNTALIAPERNAHGLLTCVRLYKDLQYPNVFLDVTEGQVADRGCDPLR